MVLPSTVQNTIWGCDQMTSKRSRKSRRTCQEDMSTTRRNERTENAKLLQRPNPQPCKLQPPLQVPTRRDDDVGHIVCLPMEMDRPTTTTTAPTALQAATTSELLLADTAPIMWTWQRHKANHVRRKTRRSERHRFPSSSQHNLFCSFQRHPTICVCPRVLCGHPARVLQD